MSTAVVSPEGQITIPQELRERLEIEPGMELTIEVQGGAIVMKRLATDLPHWRTIRGMAKGEDSLTEYLIQERRAEVARDEAENQRR